MSARFLGIVTATLLLSVTQTIAESYALKCKFDGDPVGGSGVDVKVDFEKKIITIVTMEYRITNITSRYITSFKDNFDITNEIVGGEVWVFDRDSGDFKQAAVGASCVLPDGEAPTNTSCKTHMVFETTSSSGRCTRSPVL
jgi:hypothetical protein